MGPFLQSFLVIMITLLSLMSSSLTHGKQWPVGRSTRFYDFKVQSTRVTKLCQEHQIVTVNGMYPGPVVYAQEGDRVIIKVTNETPQNVTIHWHGVRQRLSCWSDGPAYLTQCPIQGGQTFTYEFTLVEQKGTLFWHAHVSWLRATVYGALVIYPKTGHVPYPFPHPFQEHILILGEYWLKDAVQLEKQVIASGAGSPPPNAYVINGHPGPLYNCSANDVYVLEVVPGKTYMLRMINAGLNTENFFAIADHEMTVVEADGHYTKPLTVKQLMLAPGQTAIVLVTADQQPGRRYSMSMGPYNSNPNVATQNISSVAYLQYLHHSSAASSNYERGGSHDHEEQLQKQLLLDVVPARLPALNDSLVVKKNMAGLRSLSAGDVPLSIDRHLFFTIGLNEDACNKANPNKSCQAPKSGVFAASMNNVSFIKPRKLSLLQAYYHAIHGHYTDDFPEVPLKPYDFVNGAPNTAPNNTQSMNGTRVAILEYGSRVQLVMQDTGTISTENHPMHLHGYSFHVVGFGSGNYDPKTAELNLIDPPLMNTIGVPVGGWTVIQFVADNPGVWFMHCHLDVHLTWGLSMAFIVKNGRGPLETLPHPPADLPKC